MRLKRDIFKLALASLLTIMTGTVLAAHDGSMDVAKLASDIAAGEEKSQVCAACHGEQGISKQDNYPHLHGQQQTYLLRQMHYFRDGGDRRDPIMTPMLENMTDQDLVNLAAYYSSFNAVLGARSLVGGEDKAPMPTPKVVDKPKDADTPASEEVPVTTEVAAQTPAAEPAAPAPVAAPASAPPAAATAGDVAAGQTKSAACAACHGADGRGTTPLFPNLNGQKPEYLMVQLKAFRDGKRTDPTMAPMAMALSDQDIADLATFYGGLK
jgi:cytochrome c553